MKGVIFWILIVVSNISFCQKDEHFYLNKGYEKNKNKDYLPILS